LAAWLLYMFVCFSVSHVLVAQILPSSGSGGPLKRFPTPLKRTLIEPMVEIMMQNHQIMTAVDMSMTRTTLLRSATRPLGKFYSKKCKVT